MKTHHDWRDWASKLDEQCWQNFMQQHADVVHNFVAAWQAFDSVNHAKINPTHPKLSKHSQSTKDSKNPHTIASRHGNTTMQPETTTPITHELVQIAPQITPLPNARCGEDYLVSLPAQARQVVFTPECGLMWNETKQHIYGKPTHSGDVEVRYYLVHGDNLIPTRQTIYINPNPRDLWKNIPSNQQARFAKPDHLCDSVETPYGKLVAARVRGRSHAHVGKHCDDDFTIRYHKRTRIHFIAVADGAGSAEFSRLGSLIVVDAAADKIWELLDSQETNVFIASEANLENYKSVLTNLVTQAVYHAYSSLYHASKEHQISLKQLSCTLLLIIGLPLKNGQWLTVSYSIGDGALAIWQPQQQSLDYIADGDSGSYSGETRFLTADEASVEKLQKRIRTTISSDMPSILLMTDGVSDPKFETDAQLHNPEQWTALWAELQTPLNNEQPEKALEQWLDFWSAGNHDDRTLAIFIPKTKPQPCRQPEKTDTECSSSTPQESAT